MTDLLINIEDLVGMTERSAVRKVENARLIARVISRDGNERTRITAELNEERINLIISEGTVTKAWVG